MVVGNHDVVHDRVDKADESPIGVLGSRVREAYEALDECPACGQRLGDCEEERLVGV